MWEEAMLYEKLAHGWRHCFLSSHHCFIKNRDDGGCGMPVAQRKSPAISNRPCTIRHC